MLKKNVGFVVYNTVVFLGRGLEFQSTNLCLVSRPRAQNSRGTDDWSTC